MISPASLARARAAIGHGITYRMGAGGLHPDDPLPTRTGRCDCSGFVAWVCGRSRKDSIGLWWDTTRIHRDASGPQRRWRRLAAPEPGCVVVYPDHRDLATGKRRSGHCAIVVAYTAAVVGGATAALTVIDCASTPNRITERDGGVFLRHADVVFCVPVEVVT